MADLSNTITLNKDQGARLEPIGEGRYQFRIFEAGVDKGLATFKGKDATGKEVDQSVVLERGETLTVNGTAFSPVLAIPTTVGSGDHVPRINVQTDKPLQVNGGAFVKTKGSTQVATVFASPALLAELEAGYDENAKPKVTAKEPRINFYPNPNDKNEGIIGFEHRATAIQDRIVGSERGAGEIQFLTPDKQEKIFTLDGNRSDVQNRGSFKTMQTQTQFDVEKALLTKDKEALTDLGLGNVRLPAPPKDMSITSQDKWNDVRQDLNAMKAGISRFIPAPRMAMRPRIGEDHSGNPQQIIDGLIADTQTMLKGGKVDPEVKAHFDTSLKKLEGIVAAKSASAPELRSILNKIIDIGEATAVDGADMGAKKQTGLSAAFDELKSDIRNTYQPQTSSKNLDRFNKRSNEGNQFYVTAVNKTDKLLDSVTATLETGLSAGKVPAGELAVVELIAERIKLDGELQKPANRDRKGAMLKGRGDADLAILSKHFKGEELQTVQETLKNFTEALSNLPARSDALKKHLGEVVDGVDDLKQKAQRIQTEGKASQLGTTVDVLVQAREAAKGTPLASNQHYDLARATKVAPKATEGKIRASTNPDLPA